MMNAKIQIHDDYCSNMSSEDIQAILAKVTALVTKAVLRSSGLPEEEQTVALQAADKGVAHGAAPLSYASFHNKITEKVKENYKYGTIFDVFTQIQNGYRL